MTSLGSFMIYALSRRDAIDERPNRQAKKTPSSPDTHLASVLKEGCCGSIRELGAVGVFFIRSN